MHVLSYWQPGVHCTPSLAVLKGTLYVGFRYGQAVFIILITVKAWVYTHGVGVLVEVGEVVGSGDEVLLQSAPWHQAVLEQRGERAQHERDEQVHVHRVPRAVQPPTGVNGDVLNTTTRLTQHLPGGELHKWSAVQPPAAVNVSKVLCATHNIFHEGTLQNGLQLQRWRKAQRQQQRTLHPAWKRFMYSSALYTVPSPSMEQENKNAGSCNLMPCQSPALMKDNTATSQDQGKVFTLILHRLFLLRLCFPWW